MDKNECNGLQPEPGQTTQQAATQPQTPDGGWTLEQTLQALAGIDAARRGLPYSKGNGPYWGWGWLSYQWMKSGERSWSRH